MGGAVVSWRVLYRRRVAEGGCGTGLTFSGKGIAGTLVSFLSGSAESSCFTRLDAAGDGGSSEAFRFPSTAVSRVLVKVQVNQAERNARAAKLTLVLHFG
jgi:hypothetical protein